MSLRVGLCSVCGESAEFSCDNLITHVLRLPLIAIRRSDKFVFGEDGIKPAPRYRIAEITTISHFTSSCRPTNHIAYGWLSITEDGSVIRDLMAHGSARFRIERSSRCFTAVCFRHVRELSDNVHLCLNCARLMDDSHSESHICRQIEKATGTIRKRERSRSANGGTVPLSESREERQRI